jgi:hypothetical protein
LAQAGLAQPQLFQLAPTGKYSLLVLPQLRVFAGSLNLLLLSPAPQSQAKARSSPEPLPPPQLLWRSALTTKCWLPAMRLLPVFAGLLNPLLPFLAPS